MTFTRTLNFSSNDLGDDATLLLTFDDIETNKKLFVDCYPVCFKVIGFGAEGPSEATVEYQSQLAFIKPQVNKKDIVSSSTYVKIDLGQQTSLEVSAVGPPTTYKFTKPTAVGGNNIVAVNKINDKCAMGVGFVDTEGNVSTSLLYEEKEFGADNEIVAEFTPVLRGYITAAYKQNQILRATVNSPCIFNYDLKNLGSNTNWVVQKDDKGKWSIVKA